MQLQKSLEQYQEIPKSVVGSYEQANFWGCEEFLPEFSQTCQRKNNDLQKKLFLFFWAPFLLIFSRISSDFQGFCDVFQIFCPDFHGFSPNQNFWWCACTPASYTSGAG